MAQGATFKPSSPAEGTSSPPYPEPPLRNPCAVDRPTPPAKAAIHAPPPSNVVPPGEPPVEEGHAADPICRRVLALPTAPWPRDARTPPSPSLEVRGIFLAASSEEDEGRGRRWRRWLWVAARVSPLAALGEATRGSSRNTMWLIFLGVYV